MAPSPSRRTAVIVLGMHRSGTSALARVLNLCGAFLPANLRPPKQRNNPKGSWEPEEIVGLNERVLRHLGGTWNHVDFELPEDAFIDEFALDVRALLAAEYGDADDDPDQGSASLRARAALARGARPRRLSASLRGADSRSARGRAIARCPRRHDSARGARVVVGLHAAGRGILGHGRGESTYVRYTELLDDWRGVVGRIGDRLDVALDVEARADDVDRFVEPALRRQRSDEHCARRVAGQRIDRRRFARSTKSCLRWCDEDAIASPKSGATAGARVEMASARGPAPLPTATFVLCIENNAIRDQAMMLCESIRQFGGELPQLADRRLFTSRRARRRPRYAPRAGGPRRRIRRRADQLDVPRLPSREPRVRRGMGRGAFDFRFHRRARQRHGLPAGTGDAARCGCRRPARGYEGQRNAGSGRRLRGLLGRARCACAAFRSTGFPTFARRSKASGYARRTTAG